MPPELWPTAGVEYSRVRKEIAAALAATQAAEEEAARYRHALERAERMVFLAIERKHPEWTKRAFHAIQEGLEVQ